MKKWILGILLAIVLAGVALVLRSREQSAATPSAAVSSMIQAAREADINRYLGVTSGRLRAELEQTRAEMGDEGFREHLRRFGEDIKGQAILGSGEPEGDTAILDVEFVFADRNERQRTTFVRRGKGWTIASVDAIEMVKPPIPYGTPVFEEPPPAQEEGERGPSGP
jgi:hypothetical protein